MIKTSVMSLALSYLAFLPLWVLVLIKIANSLYLKTGNPMSEYVGGALIFAGTFFAIAFTEYSRRCQFGGRDPRIVKILRFQESKTVTVKFLIENVFPLFCFDCTTAEGLALTGIYFLVMASLSVKHRHFPANVYLEWRGYTFYECEIGFRGGATGTQMKTIVTQGRITAVGEEATAYRVNDEVMLLAEDGIGK